MQIKNNKSGFLLVILITFFAIYFTGCNEKVTDPANIEYDSISDIDGHVYKTVKIGSKWWMAENLKVTRYRNGDTVAYIPKDKPESVWSNLTSPAYCEIDDTYHRSGFLYNFYVIADPRNIAPVGWHIPSDDEWKELEQALGMSPEESNKAYWRGSDQGNKLKIAQGLPQVWENSSDVLTIIGTNESGFSALGGACRAFNGQWGDYFHTAFWWTSSSVNENEVWYRGLDYNKINVYRNYGSKNYGFNIRCVKD